MLKVLLSQPRNLAIVKLRRNFFQGKVFQDSRLVVSVSNHALRPFVYSEHLKPITVCPTRIEGVPLLVQPT
ncbi:MAG: hypothetical protein HCA25_21475 [Dolichospermum sp. DET50]|nr:hypothetical protein [Dolichospermum sp. DET66]MBS3034753.1 hypothetical protein [Dolichospermum sp. DET67]MBS3039956.1 hypothetical protein [Dolichospermum sp. DET50]QSX67141.1 MAG: hypothetical protein EZY12_20735 [Dolichospermum sp. DET69]